ncbi:MAG: glycine zipper family protein [Azonexus sp.]|jgi:hypothetical protein|nr:glycine zipper family protein [Azonexus sp.]
MTTPFHRLPCLALIVAAAAVGGCAVTPTGPNVTVLPGSGMTFEQFNHDDMFCRQYALNMIGGRSAGNAAQESAITSAAVGTVIGALAGVALGGDSRGAAVGAGTGLLFGSAIGSDSGRASSYDTQRQYDGAYIQCMYAKGHQVPVSGNFSYQRPAQGARSTQYRQQPAPDQPPPIQASEAGIPPPPPGAPPAPPPR